MKSGHSASKLDNPWPTIGWGMLAGVIAVSTLLGFGVLSRYQENAPTLDLWSALCRGLGIGADTAPATAPQPAPRTPTRIAWTSTTLERIAGGKLAAPVQRQYVLEADAGAFADAAHFVDHTR